MPGLWEVLGKREGLTPTPEKPTVGGVTEAGLSHFYPPTPPQKSLWGSEDLGKDAPSPGSLCIFLVETMSQRAPGMSKSFKIITVIKGIKGRMPWAGVTLPCSSPSALETARHLLKTSACDVPDTGRSLLHRAPHLLSEEQVLLHG